MFAALQNLDWLGVKSAVAIANSSPLMGLIVYYAAEVFIYFFAFLLFYMWRKPEPVAKHHGNKKAVILAIMTLAVALAVKSLIAFLVNRQRPFVTHPELLSFPLHVDSASFPSGHTLISFSVAWSLWLSGLHKWGGWLLALATLIALARVFAGVHYPTDIMGGFLIALASAWYVHREASSLKRYLPDHEQ